MAPVTNVVLKLPWVLVVLRDSQRETAGDDRFSVFGARSDPRSRQGWLLAIPRLTARV